MDAKLEQKTSVSRNERESPGFPGKNAAAETR